MARILAIQGNAATLRNWAYLFQQNGHEVIGYTSPGKALEDLADVAPDIVICAGWHGPKRESEQYAKDMTSYEFIEEIRSHEMYRNVPILGIGGFRESPSKEFLAQIEEYGLSDEEKKKMQEDHRQHLTEYFSVNNLKGIVGAIERHTS